MANAIDSIIAVKKAVYDDKICTAAELLDALKAAAYKDVVEAITGTLEDGSLSSLFTISFVVSFGIFTSTLFFVLEIKIIDITKSAISAIAISTE